MQIRQTGTAAPKLPNYQVSRDRISRPLSHTHAHSHTRVHTYHSTYQTEPQGELTILRQRSLLALMDRLIRIDLVGTGHCPGFSLSFFSLL